MFSDSKNYKAQIWCPPILSILFLLSNSVSKTGSKVLLVVIVVQLEREFLGKERFELNGRKGGWTTLRIQETIAVDSTEQVFRSDIVGHYEARQIIIQINEILNLLGFWKNDTKHVMDNWHGCAREIVLHQKEFMVLHIVKFP